MDSSIRNALLQKNIELLFETKEYSAALTDAAKSIRKQSISAANEATIVSIFEIEIFSIIRDIFGLKFFPEKEVSVDTDFHVAKGRIDSKIGALVIEFKQPSALRTNQQEEKASSQLISYLQGLYEETKQDYYGLVTDGIRCRRVILRDGEICAGAFTDLSSSVLDELVKAIVLMQKVALTPKNLVRDFASDENSIAVTLSRVLFTTLKNSATGRSDMLFNEWKELFRLAHDDKSKQQAIAERKASLEEAVGEKFPEGNNDIEYKALYAIQTTYAIIVKIIAYKVISKLQFNRPLIDFANLANSRSDVLLQQMISLEDGAIFRSIGVGNLLEGDFFSWYSNESQWSEDIASEIKQIFKTLSIYEDKGMFESFEQVQDLFKDLFMSIIPEKVRHSLGEYYTPAWLADNLVSESIKLIDNRKGWTAIDPCSGSGTFVTILIRKVLEDTAGLSKSERLHSVLSRVFAIDLNPLAVLSTRINYFVNIAHLISSGDTFEIPVFLGDSSYVPENVYVDNIQCLSYSIQTARGPINIVLPKSVCNDILAFSRMMTSIEQDILNRDTDSIVDRITELIPGPEQTENILANVSALAEKFVFLEQNNWNGIWARIVTNFITTAALGKFDLIVGNPPWIDWKSLPAGYRERIKGLCIDRNLFSGDGVTGGINLNICALITYVAAANWLKDNGVLGFLMPDTILVQQTYEGFRRLSLDLDRKLYFNRIINWSKSGNPFAPVTQNFYAYFLSFTESNYIEGIPFVSYIKRLRFNLADFAHTTTFEKVKHIFSDHHLIAGQAHNDLTKFSICTDSVQLENFRKIVGNMSYKGREGIEFYPQELFLLHYDKDIPTNGDCVAVRNFQNKKSKYKILVETFFLEKKFLQPLVKGVQIERFHLKESGLVVPFPYETLHREPIKITDLLKQSPLLARYFNRFKTIISAQTDYNAKIIGEKNNTEFYALARVGTYSFAPYYVAFRDNTKWGACVVSSLETPWGELKRPQFQNHAVSISQNTNGEFISYDEAHYICAVLNAPIISQYIISSSDTRTFKIDPDINIPRFDSTNTVHVRLSELSKLAHDNYSDAEFMHNIDKELDNLVVKL